MIINEKNTLRIIENLAALSPTQQQIIITLLKAPETLGDHVFHGGYMELTAALNKKKSAVSTIRRITLDLHHAGIINIVYNLDHPHKVDYIELPCIWLDRLTQITLNKRHDFMKVKK